MPFVRSTRQLDGAALGDPGLFEQESAETEKVFTAEAEALSLRRKRPATVRSPGGSIAPRLEE